MGHGGRGDAVAGRMGILPIVLLLVLLTAIATAFVAWSDRDAETARLRAESTHVVSRINARMTAYRALLQSCAAMLEMDSEIAPERSGKFRYVVSQVAVADIPTS